MTDVQELANNIGATIRSAEQAAQSGNMGQAIVDLGTLHGQLGEVYNVVNDYRDGAGEDPLDWDAIAGNTAAKAGGAQTNSGGTPKGPPPKETGGG